MSVTPTGRIAMEDGRRVLRLTRRFDAPATDVWASVTDPARLERWIGTWRGDRASGRVSFQMTAEGEAPHEDVEIQECDPPRTLRLTMAVGEQAWDLALRLAESDGVTILTFDQLGIDPVEAESVGPGWEYYLDRLLVALAGGDVDEVDFDRDYYPAMRGHYQEQLGD